MKKYMRFANVPNALSLYRLLSFPFILYVALKNYESLFAVLLIINLITDILDGLIARVFKLETDFGARLDSIADFGTYILAITGIFIFKHEDFQPHWWSFGCFLSLFIISHLLALLKFKRFPCLHLYSWKIGGYIQGFFFFVLFANRFYEPFYYLMVIWGILAFSEHILIQLLINEMKPNAKGLYWVLKDIKNSNK
ncbi:CDP-alcohol phosphatidyltransferase family protein [Flavobacteriaceae bacterium M23B6Z8]